jgi:hypothetical protein
MKALDTTGEPFVLTFDRTELLIISQALNEVCNGIKIEDWEFATRMGCSRAEAQHLLTQIGKVLRSNDS